MSVIPCKQNERLGELIEQFAEAIKTEAHKIGSHNLSERDFYNSGLLPGAIQRIRGQIAATMSEKRNFVKVVLNHMQDRGYIKEWEPSGAKNRHDYSIIMPSGLVAAIELKGCMDGNNTLIFERPPHAQEFVIWSVCMNRGGDPRLNAWSGINRLSADMIERGQQVDGLIIWDPTCGTAAKPCPKLAGAKDRVTVLAQYELPPACIYLMPATIASPRNNPHPDAQALKEVQLLSAFHACFGGIDDELNFVNFEVAHRKTDTVRKTTIIRDDQVVKESKLTAIRRK
jgi:hypothetical protein